MSSDLPAPETAAQAHDGRQKGEGEGGGEGEGEGGGYCVTCDEVLDLGRAEVLRTRLLEAIAGGGDVVRRASSVARAMASLLVGIDKIDSLMNMMGIAQDRAASVVWGMPGETIKRGGAQEVLPLDQIAARVLTLARAR